MKKLLVILLFIGLAITVFGEDKVDKAAANLERARAELTVARTDLNLANVKLGQTRDGDSYKTANLEKAKAELALAQASANYEKACAEFKAAVAASIALPEQDRDFPMSNYAAGSIIFGSIGLITCAAVTPYIICYPGTFQLGGINVPYWAADAGIALISLAALNYAWNETHPLESGCLFRFFGFNIGAF